VAKNASKEALQAQLARHRQAVGQLKSTKHEHSHAATRAANIRPDGAGGRASLAEVLAEVAELCESHSNAWRGLEGQAAFQALDKQNSSACSEEHAVMCSVAATGASQVLLRAGAAIDRENVYPRIAINGSTALHTGS
jgi:hypothetical protein